MMASLSRCFSSSSVLAAASGKQSVKTGIVLFNLGGPETTAAVQPFLHRLFSDPDLIPIPFQQHLAPWIAKRRSPSIEKQYAAIGGGSPIRAWTEQQGELLCKELDQLSPDTAPHKHYVAFRYAEPLTEDAVEQMKKDGITRAIAFTQYPQYSCSTTGSSLNELVRKLKVMDPQRQIQWSLIDRWATDSGLISSFADLIQKKLSEYSEQDRKDVVLLFSAHSLPMSVVNRGDCYPAEVAATVQAVMQKLNFSHSYRLVWQSQVGPAPWLGPRTDNALKGFAKAGRKNVMLVPIAFTSDHVETLFELDLEYGEEAKELGITGLKRCESLNVYPGFIKGMAQLVQSHLKSGLPYSQQLPLRCPGCDKQACKDMRSYFCQ